MNECRGGIKLQGDLAQCLMSLLLIPSKTMAQCYMHEITGPDEFKDLKKLFTRA